MLEQEEGPLRLGVKVRPPTILVEYVKYAPECVHQKDQLSRHTSASKLRRKTVRLHNLDSSKDSAQDVASALSLKFPLHFGRGVVNFAQLARLVAKLQGSLSSSGDKKGGFVDLFNRQQRSIDKGIIIEKDSTANKDIVIIDKDNITNKDIVIDKDTIIDKDIIIAKDIIDKDKQTVGDDATLSESTKQPRGQQRQGGDRVSDDVVSDVSDGVRVNLLPAHTSTVSAGEQQQRSEGSEDSAAEIKSSIGDLSEKCGEEVEDYSLIHATGDELEPLRSKAASAPSPPQAALVDVSDCADLNRISEAELAVAKTRMDVMFQRNQLLPGERGYTHDVRRDFGEAEEDCDWDED